MGTPSVWHASSGCCASPFVRDISTALKIFSSVFLQLPSGSYPALSGILRLVARPVSGAGLTLTPEFCPLLAGKRKSAPNLTINDRWLVGRESRDVE